jgi:hypothetical protein
MLVGGGLEVKTLDKKIRGTAKHEKRSRRVGSLAGSRRQRGIFNLLKLFCKATTVVSEG